MLCLPSRILLAMGSLIMGLLKQFCALVFHARLIGNSCSIESQYHK